ncbi:hypothetical protein M9Y10_043830 [Tritrichomonas musculus]|uniref:Uncharacterized protein n=1 Tax=Tritrichomonas musculus TaxID=1915356 RepID=A0ABR2K0S2_9EUKA
MNVNTSSTSPLLKSSQDVIELRFCENTDPLTVSIPSGFTPHALNSTLASLYDFGPTASFSLLNDKVLPNRIDLTATDAFISDASGKSFLLTVKQDVPDIDERYDMFVKKGKRIQPGLACNQFYLLVSGEKKYNSYFFTLYLQRFLTRAILDIINNRVSPLAKSLVYYLSPQAPTTIFQKQVVTNALIDVFTESFGDSCLWETNQPPNTLPIWKRLIGFLSALIAKREISFISIKKAIEPFQPSKVSESLCIELANALRMMMVDSEVLSIISEMFPDKFFINCFTKKVKLFNILLTGDFPPILPFVTITCLVDFSLKGKMSIDGTKEIIKQIGHPGLFASKRIIKAVIDPIMNYIFNKILANDVPYLEMTKTQLDNIMETLNSMVPILKASIFMRPIQYYTLIRIQKIMEKHGFEPKGLVFVLFSFLYDHEIIHPDVYNLYVQSNNSDMAGRNSVLLEINAYLLTIIPGPFPSISKDTPLPPKK